MYIQQMGEIVPPVIIFMYIQQQGEIVPPPCHNTVRVCNQLSFLVLYYNSYRLVSLLEVINAPIQVPDIVDLTVSFKGSSVTVQKFTRSSKGQGLSES